LVQFLHEVLCLNAGESFSGGEIVKVILSLIVGHVCWSDVIISNQIKFIFFRTVEMVSLLSDGKLYVGLCPFLIFVLAFLVIAGDIDISGLIVHKTY
jgi:hypothetical protein